MWLTADTLRNGAASGHYYENYVVMELVKNYAYAKSKVNITYFRDSNAKEIDVFIEENNVIHPLEIKKSASPDRREVKLEWLAAHRGLWSTWYVYPKGTRFSQPSNCVGLGEIKSILYRHRRSMF